MVPRIPLGKLERVDVREVWESEASGFTPWLAQEGSIALLSEAIAIELEVETQEKPVGPFRADILCKDTGSGNWVLIENQLEKTDHTHLGQLLTYAAGLDAVTIVWVSPSFTEQHRAALDWLNRITDSRFNFFGLEVEAWRIGDSPIAPKFNIISKPNDWAKAVTSSVQAASLSETRQLQFEYWSAFKQEVDSKSKLLKAQTPSPQSWMNFAIGRTGASLMLSVNTIEKRIGVTLVIRSIPNAFSWLEQQKNDIEREIGCSLDWWEVSHSSRIGLFREQTDPADRKAWPIQHVWLLEKLETFHRVFSKRIRSLPLQEPIGDQSAEA